VFFDTPDGFTAIRNNLIENQIRIRDYKNIIKQVCMYCSHRFLKSRFFRQGPALILQEIVEA
jgi:hypothetical protein